MSESRFPTSPRSKPRQHPERGTFDRETVYSILDEGLIAHVGIVVDGQPFVLPMGYGRRGDSLFLHGSRISRLLGELADGAPVCVSVTLVDGLVVARSTFSSSMNYRSVVAFGRARRVEGDEARRAALRVITEHLIPGRDAEVRPSTAKELAATEIVEVAIEEATAKTRSGGPKDPPEDVRLPTWAGVLPLAVAQGAPIPAVDLPAGVEAPKSLLPWLRPGAIARSGE